MFVDAHFHTNVYERWEGTLEVVLSIMRKHRIYALSATTDLDSYKSTLEIAKKSKFVIPCFGLHPQVALDYIDKLDSLKDHFEQAVAYSEIGLDRYHLKDESQYPAQEKLLEHFFTFAQKQNKLVVLHLDGAEEIGLEMIRNFSLKKVIVHGYKGSIQTLKEMIDYGCYFSVGGNIIMDKFKPVIEQEDWD